MHLSNWASMRWKASLPLWADNIEEKVLVERCRCYLNAGKFLLKTYPATSEYQIKYFTVSSLLRDFRCCCVVWEKIAV